MFLGNSVAYTEENVRNAKSMIEKFEANMGKTEIYQPL
jgi:hypothetical protein